jgi:hypothetical protein
MIVQIRREGSIAIVTIDIPPVLIRSTLAPSLTIESTRHSDSSAGVNDGFTIRDSAIASAMCLATTGEGRGARSPSA